MKKRTMISIIAIASALVLVLACAYVYFFYGPQAKKGKDGSEVIFQCAPESIEKISVAVGNYSYSLVKGENTWFLAGQDGKKLIDKSVSEALTVFSLIKGEEIKSIKDVSFDRTITVDKGIGEFKFNLAKKDNMYYLKDRKDKVYSISQVVYSIAERDENFYRDKSIFADAASINNKFISYNYKFSDSEKGKSEINVRLKNSSEVKRFSTESQYILDKPFVRSVDADVFERKLTKFAELEAKSFVLDAKSEADLSLFGLDFKSRKVLTVKTEEKNFVLYIGKSVDNEGIVYCMLANDNEVFTVSENSLEFLSDDPYEIIEKSLFAFNKDFVKKISVSGSGINIDITSDAGGFYIGNTPVSKESFEKAYGELESVQISFVGDENVKSTEELLKININLADGTIFSWSVIKAANEKILVSENDVLFFEIDKKEFDKLKESLKSFEKIPI